MMMGMAALAAIDGGLDETAPWSGFSRFVPRLSWHDAFLLRELPDDRRTAIAKALAQAGNDAQLVLQAHRDPMRRVVLDPEAWRNQRTPDQRSPAFRALGERASLAGALDPSALRSSSSSALVDYALAFANAQQSRGADTVVTPAHSAAGYGSPSREGELRLAQAAVSLFRREKVTERDGRAKPLLVSIAVDRLAFADEHDAVALARSYSGLDTDGFWVSLADVTEASSPAVVAASCQFLFALQGLSDGRVFAVDVKNLIWPLLAGGLFGGCIGIGEREAWPGAVTEDSGRRAIKPTVVHPELLRNFVAAGTNAKRVFREYPCECDAHEPDEPPVDRVAIRQHALRVRLLMAEAATGAGAITAVESWLTEASWAAADLGLDQPPMAAYRAALAARDVWREAATG
jgi:hypothetical protein